MTSTCTAFVLLLNHPFHSSTTIISLLPFIGEKYLMDNNGFKNAQRALNQSSRSQCIRSPEVSPSSPFDLPLIFKHNLSPFRCTRKMSKFFNIARILSMREHMPMLTSIHSLMRLSPLLLSFLKLFSNKSSLLNELTFIQWFLISWCLAVSFKSNKSPSDSPTFVPARFLNNLRQSW